MASFDFATLRSGRTVVGYFAEGLPHRSNGCGILRGRPLPPLERLWDTSRKASPTVRTVVGYFADGLSHRSS